MVRRKDFKITQVWPDELLRTRTYENALTERRDAMEKEILRMREEEIFNNIMRSMEIGQKAARRRSSIASRRSSIVDPPRRRTSIVGETDRRSRRMSRVTGSKLPSIPNIQEIPSRPPTRDADPNETVHFILPPLVLPPVHMGKKLDLKRLHQDRL
ncbi:uncharacterized protein LOC120336169 [Styela clava]|uniref:uncharacterized protein LOC120336169 n=1 Tax=Styela clava TaxID=7725 RepID=UPI00193A1736|nr:uncharacterized protein LOC120336169 [Styela clava]